jgi:hypothetical protein
MSAPPHVHWFPCQTDGNPDGFQSGERLWTHPGMTLRDWFAGQAMAGLVSDDPRVTYQTVAELAYHHADAMLAAREGGAS